MDIVSSSLAEVKNPLNLGWRCVTLMKYHCLGNRTTFGIFVSTAGEELAPLLAAQSFVLTTRHAARLPEGTRDKLGFDWSAAFTSK